MRTMLTLRAFDGLSSVAWLFAYIVGAVAVLAGVLYPAADWLCATIFLASLASVVLHLVRASLTREFLPVRLIVGINVVVLAAASLVRERLTAQTSAAIVASVPLLSYFCLCGWWLALAPPRPGEAMRPETKLRECHSFNRFAVSLVLIVEFVQFNALSFNPALGAWGDLHALSTYFSFSFFVFASSEESFEQQLWIYCSLAIGWVLFALVALSIVAHSRAVASRRPDSADGLPALGVSRLASAYRSHRSGHPLKSRGKESGWGFSAAAFGGGLAGIAGAEVSSGSDYTMNSPVMLVVRTIGLTGFRALRTHAAVLARGRDGAEHILRGAFHLGPRGIGGLFAIVLVPLFVFIAGVAIFVTVLLGIVVVLYCAVGLALCGAFAAIALLHFPILMNMLSVLNCECAPISTTPNRPPPLA